MHIPSDKINQSQLRFLPAAGEKQLYQRVQLGDLLKAEIIDSMQKQIKLLLSDGTIFNAQLEQSADVYIGQQVILEVVELLGNQIVMEISTKQNTKQPDAEVMTEDILKDFNLLPSTESKSIIKMLMQKMLPITKENVQQMLLGLKASELPIEKILTMLENDVPITPKTLNQMEAYHNGETKLQTQMENVIEHILSHNEPSFLEQVHKTLIEYKITQNDKLLDSAENNQAEPQLLQTNNNDIIIKENLNFKDINYIKEEITNLCKDLFFINPDKLKKGLEPKLQKLNELYKTIYEITNKIEEIERGIEELGRSTKELESNIIKLPTTEVYSEVKSNIEFLNMVSKYDTMLHIPLIIQNQYKHGEMYVFRKNKNSKKDYQNASVLISLDTVMLGKVEVYIKKFNKQISCQFRLQDEDIETIIKDNIISLKQSLHGVGYELASIGYISPTQSFLLDTNVDRPDSVERYRFDTKV